MWWRAALIVLAIAAAFLPMPRPLIDGFYAGRFFPALQTVATSLSNRVPFALFDVLVLLVGAWWLFRAILDLFGKGTRGWIAAFLRVGLRTVTIASAAYLAFLLAWGFNYRRAGLVDRLQFDGSRVSSDTAVRLANRTVDRANALYQSAHRAGWPEPGAIDPGLADAFARAERDLGSDGRTVPARPKQTIFDLYFRRAGVAGMTDPYFLETFVASDLLPFERPFVVAHEWSHLAGIADEGDANFAGWLTCLYGAARDQYSGWLFLYGEVVSALDGPHQRATSARLAAGPRADLGAVRERLRRQVSPVVSAAGWRVYDRYLKANQIEAGTASYAEVVRLILGAEFSEDGAPRLRSRGPS
jgi:Protein of unknown function (DUF3810)